MIYNISAAALAQASTVAPSFETSDSMSNYLRNQIKFSTKLGSTGFKDAKLQLELAERLTIPELQKAVSILQLTEY